MHAYFREEKMGKKWLEWDKQSIEKVEKTKATNEPLKNFSVPQIYRAVPEACNLIKISL
jgi:hypothetical protein